MLNTPYAPTESQSQPLSPPPPGRPTWRYNSPISLPFGARESPPSQHFLYVFNLFHIAETCFLVWGVERLLSELGRLLSLRGGLLSLLGKLVSLLETRRRSGDPSWCPVERKEKQAGRRGVALGVVSDKFDLSSRLERRAGCLRVVA